MTTASATATILVCKDAETIPADQGIKFYLGVEKMPAKLSTAETEVRIPVPALTLLEFKACYTGFLGEPTSIEQLYMAPGSCIHFQVFYDRKLRLRELVGTVNKQELKVASTMMIRALTFDRVPSYGLWLDGKKYPKRLNRGETWVPVPNDDGDASATHTFQASSFPTNTHKTYFKVTTTPAVVAGFS